MYIIYVEIEATIHVQAFSESQISALAGVAQWIECPPVNGKVSGLIPCQGTCLGCGQGTQLGACKRQPQWMHLSHIVVSPSLPSLL